MDQYSKSMTLHCQVVLKVCPKMMSLDSMENQTEGAMMRLLIYFVVPLKLLPVCKNIFSRHLTTLFIFRDQICVSHSLVTQGSDIQK